MSFNPTMHLNAEFVRNLRVNLPRRRALFIACFTLALLIVAGGLLWNSELMPFNISHPPTMEYHLWRFGQDAYWPLMVVLFGLLFVLAPAMTALSFIQERLRGTAIFQQMVLLSPFELAAGKFLGSGLISYLVAALVLPASFIAGILGDMDKPMMLRLYLFLFVGGLCCQAVGLFISAALAAPVGKSLRGGMLVGPVVGFLGAVAAIFLSHYFDDRESSIYWTFYGFDLRAYVGVLDLLLFAGVWAYAGSVRQIKLGQLIPVGPSTIWLFFASAEILFVGLLWGQSWFSYHALSTGDTSPALYGEVVIRRLMLYLFFNWVALMVLAGSYAMSRGRLREWWSVERDPLTVFQQREIKNALKTFLLALGIAEVGLLILWNSFDFEETVFTPVPWGIRMLAVAIAFALSAVGLAAFIQYCAMHRFRIGSPAGVIFTILFYLAMWLAGTMFESKNNTPALLNPVIYAYNMCAGELEGHFYLSKMDEFHQVAEREKRAREAGSILIHGLLAEGILAAGCVGLASLKLKRTRDEILVERAG